MEKDKLKQFYKEFPSSPEARVKALKSILEKKGLIDQKALDEIKDPPGKKFWPMDFGRDGCRTPMIWDESKKFAGFSNTDPWLPIKKEQIINSVKKQLKKNISQAVYRFRKDVLNKKYPSKKYSY